MQNIGHILGAAGLGFQNVVKASIFLRDMNDFAAVNEIYGSFFTKEPPARETVQVARLPKDVNVEYHDCGGVVLSGVDLLSELVIRSQV
jgi:2-iminobutanoate/2-iminopropanoate deaminase